MNRMLDLVNGATRIEVLGASVSAVHDSVAAIELVGVIQTLQTLLGHLVSRVGDPSVGLLQDGGSEVLVAVPPVGGTGGGAAGAEDALVQTVQQQTILVRLQILHLVVRVHRRLLLQPRLDRRVLLVEVGHVSSSHTQNNKPGIRSRNTNMWGRGRIVIVSGPGVIFVKHARPFSPLMFIAQEPQIPSRQDRLKAKVGSILFLI